MPHRKVGPDAPEVRDGNEPEAVVPFRSARRLLVARPRCRLTGVLAIRLQRTATLMRCREGATDDPLHEPIL
jgi:hypothetical protein